MSERCREVEAVLYAVFRECLGTGGEFWAGTNESTYARMKALWPDLEEAHRAWLDDDSLPDPIALHTKEEPDE